MLDEDLKRRLVYSALSFALGAIATRIALYLTEKLVGAPSDA